VEVTGRSGAGVPELRPADSDAEGGRGLQLVAGIAARLELAAAWRADGDLVRAIARLASAPDGKLSLSMLRKRRGPRPLRSTACCYDE